MSVDQDKDVLAGEYVLGTLDSFARAEAQALLTLDPQFAAAVKAWERRLGELSAMIASVEPPQQAWEKINEPVAKEAAARRPAAPPSAPTAARPAVSATPVTPQPAVPAPETSPSVLAGTQAAAPPEAAASQQAAETREGAATSETAPAAAQPSGQVIQFSPRVRRWQASTAAFGLLAASLLALIVVRETRPEFLPRPLQPTPVVKEVVRTVEVIKTVEVPAPEPAEFVAVLQKDAASPAFLLSFDFAKRTVLVRAVGAERQSGKSYELWLVSDKLQSPRSLGVIGEEPFTRRALGDFDPVTINRATYAVSLEPQGGSPTGAPTGPVLFAGKLVQTTPPGLVSTP